MGDDMFNDEQLAHAEIVQKEAEDALGFWKERALEAEAALAALSRARETDGAVGEAAERLWCKLTPPTSVTENGCVFASAEDIETVLRALSSPPRPETKDARPMTRDEADAVEEIESAMFAAPPADAATEAVREAQRVAIREAVERPDNPWRQWGVTSDPGGR